MCIIMYQKNASIPVKAEWMKNSAKSNADGFGMSFMKDGVLTIYKTMSFDDFRLHYREMSDKYPKSPFLLHFRKNTKGRNNLENCHPFEVKGNVAMMHNGSIGNINVPYNGQYSDTNLFTKEVLNGLPLGWESNESTLRILKTFITGSKLAIMNGKGEVSFVNEGDGHWYEGLWMSNYSYYPNTRSIQSTKPKTWDANSKSLVVVNSNKYKTQIYKHPNGDFSRYLKGKLLRWFKELYSWREVTVDNLVKMAGLSLNSDSPSTYHHTIIESDKNIEDRVVTKTPSKHVKKHQCGYCGDMFPASELIVHYVEYTTTKDESPYDVFCTECGLEMELAELGSPRKHLNTDYFLRDKFIPVWAD